MQVRRAVWRGLTVAAKRMHFLVTGAVAVSPEEREAVQVRRVCVRSGMWWFTRCVSGSACVWQCDVVDHARVCVAAYVCVT